MPEPWSLSPEVMAGLSGTHLRYLAAIHELGCGGKAVSSADVARALNVSRPSVTRMLLVMSEKGMTTKERYGKIELTEEGLLIASAVSENIRSLAQLLCSSMGLTDDSRTGCRSRAAGTIPEMNRGGMQQGGLYPCCIFVLAVQRNALEDARWLHSGKMWCIIIKNGV